MIIIKSDYSPAAASEKLEEENTQMMHTLLLTAGLKPSQVQLYRLHTTQAAIDYETALNHSPEDPEKWERAKAATIESLAKAEKVLINAGVTISNEMKRACVEGYFSHIETTVFKNHSKMTPVARIERAVLDEEVDTYEGNMTGWGAHNG